MGNLTIGKGGKDARVELPPGLRSRQEAKRSPDLSTDINRVHEPPAQERVAVASGLAAARKLGAYNRQGSEGVRPREDSKEGVTLSKDVLGRVPKKKGSRFANNQTRVEEGTAGRERDLAAATEEHERSGQQAITPPSRLTKVGRARRANHLPARPTNWSGA